MSQSIISTRLLVWLITAAEVGADEGLPIDRLTPVIIRTLFWRLHHGEVEAGTQAADGFNREVSRVTTASSWLCL